MYFSPSDFEEFMMSLFWKSELMLMCTFHLLPCKVRFEARKILVRCTAVMSAVGMAVGLGDRHLRNILVNINDGGVMHVDFDCILNKVSMIAFATQSLFTLFTCPQYLAPLNGSIHFVNNHNNCPG